MNRKYKAEELLRKYRQGICTEEEKVLIESWHNKELAGKNYVPSADELEDADRRIWDALPLQKDKKRFGFRLLAAASVILVFSAGLYLITQNKPKEKQQTAVHHPSYQTDVLPGANRAVLTLADGSKIILDKDKNGFLASQGSSLIKAADGQLIYNLKQQADNETAGPAVLNLISTPKGGQYQLTLSDGTRVWLNAASSLRFPAVFSKEERSVELNGEAYFEVAENKNIPFRVTAGGQMVEVLGTHFNINAYDDESQVKTTLLEGAVKVFGQGSEAVIRPGQQTVFNRLARSMYVQPADMEEAVAWKKGYFQFSNEKIESIMRKISRWYDVDIEYHGDYTKQGFVGTISKFENVSKVLRMLELTGTVQFKIETQPAVNNRFERTERRIIVMP